MEKTKSNHFYSDNFIVFGHRGVPSLCQENTIESFLKAIELNYTGIELDILETKDRKLIIHHDQHLRVKDKSKKICDLSLEEIVKQDPSIPTLQSILSSIGHKTNINIEIKHQKSREEHVAKEVIMQLKNYNLIENIIISSFNARIIKKIKLIDDRFATAFIIGKNRFWNNLLATSIWKYLKIDAIHVDHKILTRKIIAKAHKKGLKVLPYTINDIKSFKKIKELGVDGLFTDSPDILFASRSRYEKKS